MKKEIKIVNEELGIVQITTYDERWYAFTKTDTATGLPAYHYVPSVTWICEHYPKGIPFYKWLADKGWNEAEAIKIAAGDKGSKVHHAVLDLLMGNVIQMSDKYWNETTEKDEELTVEEYACVLSFADWFTSQTINGTPPEIKVNELSVINKTENYAGTIDLICVIADQHWIIDFKTSQYIWPSHELQLSAYKHALKNKEKIPYKLGILQLGYHQNKRHYKFTEIADKYDEFLAAKVIWANETKGVQPLQRDYPLSVTLNIPKESEVENANKTDKSS